jgi:SET domain-containing protein
MKFILKPSTIENAGVGVFSVENIKSGAKLTLGDIKGKLLEKELEDIPDEFLKYCPLLSNNRFLCPENFNQMTIFWYLNHSNLPNVSWLKEGFYSNREILKNEELTVYYPDLLTHPKNKLWNQKYIKE